MKFYDETITVKSINGTTKYTFKYAGGIPFEVAPEDYKDKTDLMCPLCKENMYTFNNETRTLVGYHSPEGHDHDDNCRSKSYRCPNNHFIVLSKRNRCPNPNCDWVGKDECFCHDEKKVDEYPGRKGGLTDDKRHDNRIQDTI